MKKQISENAHTSFRERESGQAVAEYSMMLLLLLILLFLMSGVGTSIKVLMQWVANSL
jgi:hypothetical protein